MRTDPGRSLLTRLWAAQAALLASVPVSHVAVTLSPRERERLDTIERGIHALQVGRPCPPVALALLGESCGRCGGAGADPVYQSVRGAPVPCRGCGGGEP